MKHEGSCHCGRVAFDVEGDIGDVIDCNCSLCRRRGGLLWFVPREALVLKTPEGDLSTYTFNRHHIRHHFCAVCGCATFSDSPAFEPDGEWDGQTRRICVNARLLAGIVAEDLPVDVIDGKHLW